MVVVTASCPAEVRWPRAPVRQLARFNAALGGSSQLEYDLAGGLHDVGSQIDHVTAQCGLVIRQGKNACARGVLS